METTLIFIINLIMLIMFISMFMSIGKIKQNQKVLGSRLKQILKNQEEQYERSIGLKKKTYSKEELEGKAKAFDALPDELKP